MKLEVTMKEMQELMNRKGQVEIMGKSYTLNPQDELLIKFMMDFKERHQTDYYDILSNAFNNVLMSETMQYNCGIAGGINLVPLTPGFYSQGGRVEPMPVRPYQQSYGYCPDMSYKQAPQMSYNDMKNMYKNQFAQQLGLDIDGDEKHEDPTYGGCDCHVCDGNCEDNLPDNEYCDDCRILGITKCDNKCEEHHKEFSDREKFIKYKLNKDCNGLYNRLEHVYNKCLEKGEVTEADIKEAKDLAYKLGYKDGEENQVEYNPFAKAMMGNKVDLDDPKLKTMPKVETYQAKHPISNKKDEPKKTDEPKGTPVVTPEIIFKPKKKTDDETQKILSSKVMKSDEDK